MNYILQILSEFFPISSTLFLKSLNFSDDGIFHIFSGLLFIIIFYNKILLLIKYPKKNSIIIINYILITLPSIILGIITTFGFLNFNFSYKFQIITNIIMGIFLYLTTKYFNKNHINNFLKEVKKNDSIILGLLLSLNGIFPGMSRLGTSLTFLLFRGYSPSKSYEVSLITSIPIIIGKPLVFLIKNKEAKNYLYNFSKEHFLLIIFSFLVGFFLYRIIHYHISSKTLKLFSIIRIIYFSYLLIILVM
jgi:undecaprenyl pyrophosphate phosphatase UppP